MEKTVCGVRVAYTDCGNGPFVFLLHGWGANKELFASLVSLLSRQYRVIAPDFPGFGQSDEPPTPWDVGQYADFTLEFIQSFHAQSVILLGHSFGGRVCIKLASRNAPPLQIEKLILTGSAGILPRRSAGFYARQRLYKIGKAILSCPPVKRIAPGALEALRQKNGSPDYAAASAMMRQVFVRVVNEDLAPLLPKIPQETLLIWGENDDATPLCDGERMEREIPEAGLAKIAGAGHYAWLDQPHVFQAVLKSYLQIN